MHVYKLFIFLSYFGQTLFQTQDETMQLESYNKK